MTHTAETVEYAVRCADGVVLLNRFDRRGDAEKYLAAEERGTCCSPHTVVQRRRIVTDWEPVGGTMSDKPSLTADSSPDPEIVRKVAEALTEIDPHVAEMFQHVVGDTARIVLAVAEPLIREQVAQEIEASRATNTFRTTVLERAAKIARGGQ